VLFRKSMCALAAWLCVLSICPVASAVDASGFDSGDPWAKFDDTPLYTQPLFDEKPLFDQPLWSNDSLKQRLSSDVAPPAPSNNNINSGIGHTIDTKIANSQIDDEMRRQMRAVARWLYNYNLRNGSRFPGPAGNMDIMYAAQTQLTELVPNNPYAYGDTQAMNWGIPAVYNANGSPATGSPVWDDQYQAGLVANQVGRVQLQFDYGLNPNQANEYANHPPDTWTAKPGVITAIGNNQGFFIVWGADTNGNPIRNPINGKIYVISVSTSGTVNDTSAPNGT
jgi:hypothetical protein